MDFFKYDKLVSSDADYHKLTTIEWLMPILFVVGMVVLFVMFKERIRKSDKLDKQIRYSFGGFLAIMYIVHYVLRYSQYGVQLGNLPLQLCSMSTLMTIIILFTKNKPIHSFVLFSGVLGGFGTLLTPDVGYSYEYFRYYQFMTSHTFIVIIPLYFVIVHSYIPTFKITIRSALILQTMAIIFLLFNTQYGTDYFYIAIAKDLAHDDTILSALGTWPWSFVNLILLGYTLFFILFGIFRLAYFNHPVFKKTKELKSAKKAA